MTRLIMTPEITCLEICQVVEQVVTASSRNNLVTHKAPFGSVEHIASVMPKILEKTFEAGWARGVADCRGEILPAAAPSALVSAISDELISLLQQLFSTGYAHGLKAGFSPIQPDSPDFKITNPAALEKFFLQNLIPPSSPPRKRLHH